MKELGQRIAKQRKIAGLTQAQLAERVAVQPESISRIERGRRTPSLGLVVALANELDLELHDLFRVREKDEAKDGAIERLHWFALRLSVSEIELVLSVAAVVLKHRRDREVR